MNEVGAHWYVLQAIDPELGCPSFEFVLQPREGGLGFSLETASRRKKRGCRVDQPSRSLWTLMR